MNFKILDLFCGAGGFSAGFLHNKGFSVEIGVDFDRFALETFSKNFPNAIAIFGDISNSEIKNNIIEAAKKRSVNMIIGGPPCQGFSLKGKNLGLEDSRNYLFKEYLNIVKEIQPEIFIIENVKNILNSACHYFRDEILKEIKSLGYIVNFGTLNAKDYGVPQNRERAFFIASKSKFIHFPNPLNSNVTVRDAISDLAYLESGEGEIISNYINAAQSNYQTMLRGKCLQHHKASTHSFIALKKLKMIPAECGKEYLPAELKGKQKFSTTRGRLERDKISPTIDTRFDTPSNGKNSHPFLNRAITPREAARIQSFNDDFYFYGPKGSVCKQIGNAVPPLLAKAIGKQILNDYKNNVIQKEHYKLYYGNAYSIVDELIKNHVKVNHIITDPPYKISEKHNFNTLRTPRVGVYFGERDTDFDLFSWIPKYEKILDSNGSIIIFCSYRYISFIVKKLEESNFDVKDVLIWKKKNPMPRNTNRRYVQDMEFAIWGIKKGAKWVFNKDDSKPYMRSCFETSVVAGKERTFHPTQKSLKLMQEIIKIHTLKNQIILDPFMGSGTTGLACLNLDRNFIGIECNKKYFNLALDRFGEAKVI